jgi:hypothetical protein
VSTTCEVVILSDLTQSHETSYGYAVRAFSSEAVSAVGKDVNVSASGEGHKASRGCTVDIFPVEVVLVDCEAARVSTSIVG